MPLHFTTIAPYDGYTTEAEAIAVRDRLAELYPEFAAGLSVDCTSESTREDLNQTFGVVYSSDDLDMVEEAEGLTLAGPSTACAIHQFDDCPACDRRNDFSDELLAELGI